MVIHLTPDVGETARQAEVRTRVERTLPNGGLSGIRSVKAAVTAWQDYFRDQAMGYARRITERRLTRTQE